jgi:uncharacterized protein
MKSLLAILAFVIFTDVNAQDATTDSSFFPKAVGFVNDFDSIFTNEEKSTFYAIIKQHELLTTNQIAIITIRHLPDSINIDSYATRLFNYWGIGTKEKNNGVLILLCRSCRSVVIRNGYGIEKLISDSETKLIVQKMLPYFKETDYYSGVLTGLQELVKKLQ